MVILIKLLLLLLLLLYLRNLLINKSLTFFKGKDIIKKNHEFSSNYWMQRFLKIAKSLIIHKLSTCSCNLKELFVGLISIYNSFVRYNYYYFMVKYIITCTISSKCLPHHGRVKISYHEIISINNSHSLCMYICL